MMRWSRPFLGALEVPCAPGIRESKWRRMIIRASNLRLWSMISCCCLLVGCVGMGKCACSQGSARGRMACRRHGAIYSVEQNWRSVEPENNATVVVKAIL